MLSLHCQPPEDAAHLLREAELRTCKRGSVLVNTCSGALVEPVALKLALQDGLLGGAALDAPEGACFPLPRPLLASALSSAFARFASCFNGDDASLVDVWRLLPSKHLQGSHGLSRG